MADTIAGKIRAKYAEGGLRCVLAGVLSGLHARTFGRLDYLLFARYKWRTIGRGMINPFVYRFASALSLTEAEHQLGRLLHMYSALEAIKSSGQSGDIVEFGSYQGFSLYWLSRFRDELGLSMRVIGIDSFEGLPESSTIWKKGLFNDTSRTACEKAILRASGADSLSERNIYIIQGLFNDPRVAVELRALTSGIILAHIDCDLGSSCTQALALVGQTGARDPLYLLFDDWFWHPEEIPASFESFMRGLERPGQVEELSATKYTRYLRVSGTGRPL
ncbi:MAG: hypothetical protein COX65_09245 [Elusimicrobia bacterium CG_4_10_14_0_2_um_filter_56_8]|nr:MAG: hypothetical protein COX65_09245 [Elusimicrobia bacterium CG_4_10_14_0_2_um_filter_56_8]